MKDFDQELEEESARRHEAFLLALFGLTPHGVPVDPFLFAAMMGQAIAEASPEEAAAMRGWSLRQWAPVVRGMLVSSDAEEPAPSVALVPLTPGAPPSGPPGPVVHAGEVEPTPRAIPIPAPPPGLSEALRESWVQARARAGEFARGLGNYVLDDLKTIVGEVWSGEHVVEEGDVNQRLSTAGLIREQTARALADGWTVARLASELANRTKDWARNWQRIARTELQGAHNEGAAITAHRVFGDEARIARVPNADACDACRGLFLDGDGRPRVFTVAEIVANGTNVGRSRKEWLPTLWPIHPNCVCSTQTVPPGMAFNDAWELA